LRLAVLLAGADLHPGAGGLRGRSLPGDHLPARAGLPVHPDGMAECRVAREVGSGGAGCACEVGRPARTPGLALIGLPALLLIGRLRRRRGRRA
jgi:MYXO-CTERM domain-containing protein